jgi:hypothetical protein
MTPRVQIAHADQTPASTAAVKRPHDLGRGVVAAAERRPADDWMLLGRLCGETPTRLTMIVEQPASDRHVAALGGDVRELTLAELVAETPVMPEDPWGLFDRSGSPDDRPGYPPVPDVDFAATPRRQFAAVPIEQSAS